MTIEDGRAPMTEAELFAGITEALTLAGWRWTHIRRSDGVTVGSPGLPDIIATHPNRAIVLAWELKGEGGGRRTVDQAQWIIGLRGKLIDSRFVDPAWYDAALRVILEPSTDVLVSDAFYKAGSPLATDDEL